MSDVCSLSSFVLMYFVDGILCKFVLQYVLVNEDYVQCEKYIGYENKIKNMNKI